MPDEPAPVPATDQTAGASPPAEDLEARAIHASVFRDLFSHRDDRIDLGRYALLHKLGQGGMGVVYAAYDDVLDRKVAVKFIRPRQAADTKARGRLLREAKAMARISHPSVVAVFDAGEAHGHVFIAMEFVEGRSLSAWLGERRRSWTEVVDLFARAGEGLAAAHAMGVVHRDFKPGNVLIDDGDRPRVADFGLAGLEHHESTETSPDDPNLSPEDALTRTGAAVGTPAYMAPEQHQGHRATAASDQFAFCVALWEALFGHRPFAGRDLSTLRANVLAGALLAEPSSSDVPAWLRAIVRRGLRTDAEQRFPSMAALLAELERGRRSRSRWLWPTAFAGLCGTALWVGLASPAREPEAKPCADGWAGLAETWDERRRAAVTEALADVDAPYAEDTAARVGRRLQDYAEAWVSGWKDACVATRVQGEQSEALLDLRMTCLDDRRRALRAQLEVFEHADAEVLRHAVESVAALPRVPRCADLDYVRAAVPLPDDPAEEQEVAELRHALVRVSALRRAGKYDAAAEELGPTLERARALGYVPLLAEALVEHGATLHQQGSHGEAIDAYRDAYQHADGAGADETRLHAAIGLLDAVGSGTKEPAGFEPWAELAWASWRRVGQPAGEEIELHLVLSARAALTDRLDEAIEHLERARELATDDPLRLAELRGRMGSVQLDRGLLDEAEPEIREALRLRAQELGPEHPSVGLDRGLLGFLLHQQQRFDEAEPELREALRIQRSTLGDQHPEIASTLSNLARVLREQERHEEARDALVEAREIAVETVGPEHLTTASIHNDLGLVLEKLGQSQEAMAELREGVRSMSAVYGPEHPVVFITRLNMARAMTRQGEPEAGLAELEAARDEAAAVPEPNPRLLGWLGYALGFTYDEQGRLEEAVAAHRLGLEQRIVDGTDTAAIMDSHAYLGHALHRVGRDEEAVEHVRVAVEWVDALGQPSTVAPIAHLAWAEVMTALGRERTRALEVARKARAEAEHPPLRAAVDAWLAEHGDDSTPMR